MSPTSVELDEPEENSTAELPDFQPYLSAWHSDIQELRQNKLLNENAFIRFCQYRGIPVSGVVTGDPGEFHHRGWLTSDGVEERGGLTFHPFRFFCVHQILTGNKPNIVANTWLDPVAFQATIDMAKQWLPTHEQIKAAAEHWNRVVDLAILLEPIYWPRVIGQTVYSGMMFFSGYAAGTGQQDVEALRDTYRVQASDLIKSLNPAAWRDVHYTLRRIAAGLDNNDKLYVLLRLSHWQQRERLTGQLSCALWLRHMAEVLRRAFEEGHGVNWPEEEYVTGMFAEKVKLRDYGSSRVFDIQKEARPYVALSFGLIKGSVVRWYVEGETEYGAIDHALPERQLDNIEVVNILGNFVKLGDWLKEDIRQKRLSMVSFDKDRDEIVRMIRHKAKAGEIVGNIGMNAPDFEFANFTVEELAEVAARIDEAYGYSGDPVRHADWTGVDGGKKFEEAYEKISARKPRNLKGIEWGKALAAFAQEHPNRAGTDERRPFLEEIWLARKCRIVDYNLHRDTIDFDPTTLKQKSKAGRDSSFPGPVLM